MLGDESGLPWTILASRLRLAGTFSASAGTFSAEIFIIDFVWDGKLIADLFVRLHMH